MSWLFLLKELHLRKQAFTTSPCIYPTDSKDTLLLDPSTLYPIANLDNGNPLSPHVILEQDNKTPVKSLTKRFEQSSQQTPLYIHNDLSFLP